jgi:hypothetical protein
MNGFYSRAAGKASEFAADDIDSIRSDAVRLAFLIVS